MAIFAPNPEAIARVPRSIAFRYDVLPLSVTDGVLAVALADPHDATVIDTVCAATHMRIRPLPMGRDAIRENLRVAYGGEKEAIFRKLA